MNFHRIWTLSKHEMLSSRKLARTWVFFCIVFLISGACYFLLDFRNTSLWPSPPTSWLLRDSFGARYLFNDIIAIIGFIFVVGVVILCFDFRYRNVQARIHDVLDTKPANNLEFIVGRTLGILSLILIPILLFFLLASCYEIVAQIFSISHRYGMHPISAFSRTMWSVLPVVLLFITFVMCIATFVRTRLLVALITIGAVSTYVCLFAQLPHGVKETFTLFPGALQVHSDLAPAYFSTSILVNRVGVVMMSIAFIAVTTSSLRHVQPNKAICATTCVGCLLGSALCVVSLSLSLHSAEIRKNDWVRAHSEQQIAAFPDIQHIQGSVNLLPGRMIDLDLTLNVVPPPNNPTDSVIFSLNPGYRILNVYIDGSVISDYEFSNGLLKIPTSKLSDEEHRLNIVATGRPNEKFAYLDQVRDYQTQLLPFVEDMGTHNYVFHSEFVALVPAVKWYPTSGTALNEDLLEQRPRDVFTTDINVSVPKEWTVAMVGSREPRPSQKRATFQFNTVTPVPALTLIAANFESRSAKISGVNFELLFSKKHRRNLTALAPYTQELKEWVSEHLRKARDLSLEYPYDTFYVVEVPSTLRIFGGGWRMNSVLQPPGMMLMRETNFPTARFDLALRFNQIDPIDDSQFMLKKLLTYFEDDVYGGNPFSGICRNYLNHRSSPTGRGSTVLDFLVEELATELILDRDSLFVPSFWEYGTRSYASVVQWVHRGGRRFGPATTGRKIIAKLPSTWEEIEHTSLFDLEFSSKPIPAFRALLTKTDILGRSMVEQYGTKQIANFLRELTSEFQGKSYTLQDFFATATTFGVASDDWVRGWLEEATLPGYLVDNAQITKLSTSATTNYQTSFVLYNAESVPGLVRVFWSATPDVNFSFNYGDIRFSDPIFLSGNQSVKVSIQSVQPLIAIEIDPYLALNRANFSVPLPKVDEESIVHSSEQPFLSDIEWSPRDDPSVIVDDLDKGFSIQGQSTGRQNSFINPFTVSVFNDEEELDFGLPVKDVWFVRGEWSRVYDDKSYGRYRRTYTLVEEGKQITSAKFFTALPHAGRWDLAYYLPEPAFLMSRPENTVVATIGVRSPLYYNYKGISVPDTPEERYLITIRDGDSEWTEEFDITQAGFGWNKVGTYQLGTTEAEVLVSDFGGHEDIKVFADAVRWTPVDTK